MLREKLILATLHWSWQSQFLLCVLLEINIVDCRIFGSLQSFHQYLSRSECSASIPFRGIRSLRPHPIQAVGLAASTFQSPFGVLGHCDNELDSAIGHVSTFQSPFGVLGHCDIADAPDPD